MVGVIIMSVNEKFIINLQGKSFVTYEGLLDLAHQRDLKSLEVSIIQMPSSENNMTAICVATATTETSTFQDIGDASPSSVNKALVPHLIRMASTRAKARALRDLTNVGMTAVEELSVEENPISEDQEGYNINTESHITRQNEPPTPRQVETIKKLAEQLNQKIEYDNLTKKTAGSMISKLIEETKNS